MYMAIGAVCVGVGFALALNRKAASASVVLFLLGGMLIYAQLTSQP
jgi:hypothetical protein